MEQIAKLKRTCNIGPDLQIVQKIPESYCPCLYLVTGQVSLLHELWLQRYIQKCILFHVLILIMTSQIWQITGWLKNTKTWMSWERNITFLRNKKILNLDLRWHILRSYHFVTEVTFKDIKESNFFFNFSWWNIELFKSGTIVFCFKICWQRLWDKRIIFKFFALWVGFVWESFSWNYSYWNWKSYFRY